MNEYLQNLVDQVVEDLDTLADQVVEDLEELPSLQEFLQDSQVSS